MALGQALGMWRTVALEKGRGVFGKAVAVVALTVLPFYLWNPDAFVLSVITLQARVPLRLDEISYADYVAVREWFTSLLSGYCFYTCRSAPGWGYGKRAARQRVCRRICFDADTVLHPLKRARGELLFFWSLRCCVALWLLR